jgi:hypothetical protein
MGQILHPGEGSNYFEALVHVALVVAIAFVVVRGAFWISRLKPDLRHTEWALLIASTLFGLAKILLEFAVDGGTGGLFAGGLETAIVSLLFISLYFGLPLFVLMGLFSLAYVGAALNGRRLPNGSVVWAIALGVLIQAAWTNNLATAYSA